MKTDTFPRPAFRVSTDALKRVVIEPVTVHSLDRLRGVAAGSRAVPGFTLRNDVPFAELARDGRRAARLAARLVLDPAGFAADRCASAAARVSASLSSLPSKTANDFRPGSAPDREEQPSTAGVCAGVKLPGLRPLSRSADTGLRSGESAVHRSEPARGATPATQPMAGSVAA